MQSWSETAPQSGLEKVHRRVTETNHVNFVVLYHNLGKLLSSELDGRVILLQEALG